MITSAPSTQQSPAAMPPKRPPGSGSSQAPAAFAALDPMKLLQQYYSWLVAAAIMGVVIGLGAFYALRQFYPRWDSEVVFEALPEAQRPDDPIGGGSGNDRLEMEAHMNTLVRVMESDLILGKAIDERVVKNTNWATQFRDPSGGLDRVEALRELRKIVNAWPLADTKIIILSVGTPIKDDAPNIANAIADVFLADTQTRSTKDMSNLIQQFEEVVRQLSKDLASLEDQKRTLLQRAELTSLRQESTVQQNEVQNLQPTIVKMREERTMAEEQLKRYEQLLNNPGGPVIPEAVRGRVDENPLIAQQDQSISGIKGAIRAQKGEFGDNHPEVKRLERRLAAAEAERAALAERLMRDEFQTVIENLRNSTKNMEASLAQSTERLTNAERQLQDITAAIKQHEDLDLDYQSKIEKKGDMERRIDDMKLMLARGTRVRMLSKAEIPDQLAFPKIIPTVAVSVVLVAGLAAGLIALREIREQRVRGPQDVALIPRTRVLGMVPDISMDPSTPVRAELAVIERPQGIIAESIRQLRQTMIKEASGRGLRTIMIVSGLPGSGASSMAVNLAANAANADMRVLLIDANLRRPALHTLLEVPESPGVADILLGNAPMAQCVRATSIPNLSLLPCGSREKPVFERFTGPVMHALIAEAKANYDIVLIDSTPGVVSGDAVALAGHCDGVVLVVRAYSEKRGLVARLRSQLGEAHAEFLGVVVNAVQASAGGYFKRNFQVSHEYGRDDAALADTTTRNGKAPKKKSRKDAKEEAAKATEEAAHPNKKPEA